MKTVNIIFTIVLYVIHVASGESVISITLNTGAGQIYALSSTGWLYELDNVVVEQNNGHQLNLDTYQPTFRSSYVKAIEGKKYFFQLIADVDNYNTKLARFDLPFGNKPILTPSALTEHGYGITSVPAVFSGRDSIALSLTNDDQLHLYDLESFNQTDTVDVMYNGIRKAVTVVIYDYKTDRAVLFWYRFSLATRTYTLLAFEYDVVDGKLVQVNTTFAEGREMFRNTRASSGAFDASNNRYWILDDQSNNLIRFNANNLAKCRMIPLGCGITFDLGVSTAVYDFESQLAYVLSDSSVGYRIQEVDLVTGEILRTAVLDTGGLYVATAYLDVEEGNIYVGLLEAGNSTPATISVVDLANLSQRLIVLTH